jgi:hypothetical protein
MGLRSSYAWVAHRRGAESRATDFLVSSVTNEMLDATINDNVIVHDL